MDLGINMAEIIFEPVPMTPQELAERKQWAAEEAERQKAEEAKLAAKETAKAKLAKLGLTEEEISALTS
jgi:hypothetical protein